MNLQEIDPLELGKQLRQPTGETGKVVGETMNVSNSSMYSLAFEMMELSKVDNFLEIGFGNGFYLKNYLNLNPDMAIYGIDFSRTMYEDALIKNFELINKNKLFLNCGNALEMPYSDNFFDFVLTLNTVYFWKPREKQIQEILRVLKPEGRLLIGFRPKSFMEHLPFTQEVFDFYEMEDLRTFLQHSGFEILKEESREILRTAIDGTQVSAIDACIIAKKRI